MNKLKTLLTVFFLSAAFCLFFFNCEDPEHNPGGTEQQGGNGGNSSGGSSTDITDLYDISESDFGDFFRQRKRFDQDHVQMDAQGDWENLAQLIFL